MYQNFLMNGHRNFAWFPSWKSCGTVRPSYSTARLSQWKSGKVRVFASRCCQVTTLAAWKKLNSGCFYFSKIKPCTNRTYFITYQTSPDSLIFNSLLSVYVVDDFELRKNMSGTQMSSQTLVRRLQRLQARRNWNDSLSSRHACLKYTSTVPYCTA